MEDPPTAVVRADAEPIRFARRDQGNQRLAHPGQGVIERVANVPVPNSRRSSALHELRHGLGAEHTVHGRERIGRGGPAGDERLDNLAQPRARDVDLDERVNGAMTRVRLDEDGILRVQQTVLHQPMRGLGERGQPLDWPSRPVQLVGVQEVEGVVQGHGVTVILMVVHCHG